MKKVIATAQAPTPIGPYSQAILIDDTLYASGQLGINIQSGQLEVGVVAQTKRVFDNIAAILSAADMTFDNIIKTTVFLKNMDDFVAVNTEYGKYFTGDFPARSAIQVAKLPLNADVEIEFIAKK